MKVNIMYDTFITEKITLKYNMWTLILLFIAIYLKPDTPLVIWKKFRKNSFNDFCNLKNCPYIPFNDSEILLAEIEDEIPETPMSDDFCALKSKKYANKTKLKGEKT